MDSSGVAKGLLYGGIASCTAELFTLPVDTVKTRMQLRSSNLSAEVAEQYSNSFKAFYTIVSKEGVTALWKGLSPALLRQSIYGSLRYGLYGPIKGALGMNKHNEVLWKKVVAGSIAGALSSVIANPTDLVKVRMQAEGMTGTSSRSYKGLFPTFVRIVREEGFLGLWKGVGATCGRATALAAAELASYDEIKTQLLKANLLQDGLSLHLGSALGAGFLASLVSSPFDVVKSRVMQQPTNNEGKGLYYSGMVDCFQKSIKNEGISCLWKGFGPNYARVGPRVVIAFIVMEWLKKTFN